MSSERRGTVEAAGGRWGRERAGRCGLTVVAAALCLAGCQSAGPARRGARVIHAYDGAPQPTNALVHVKVVAPIKVSFVDEVPVKAANREIVALLPGEHKLIAGAPVKQRSGSSFADKLAAGLSENKEVTLSGRAGDLFTLGPDPSDSLGSIRMTMNGVTIPLPKTYRATLTPVTNAADVARFFAGAGQAVAAPLRRPFLDVPANARDYAVLQGEWRVVGINMEGEDFTVEQYKERARTRGGDTKLLDMKLSIRGVRMKWTGSKVRGETVLVDMDAARTPKSMRQLSVGNGEDQTLAIYDVQGDRLKYCFGPTTPRSFTSAPEMARLCFLLQREPEAKSETGGAAK